MSIDAARLCRRSVDAFSLRSTDKEVPKYSSNAMRWASKTLARVLAGSKFLVTTRAYVLAQQIFSFFFLDHGTVCGAQYLRIAIEFGENLVWV